MPLPVLKPWGVGLCWTMKLYQSITQTNPSGPNFGGDGGGPFVVTGKQVPSVVGGEVGPARLEIERRDQVARGLGDERLRVPASLGISPGSVESVPSRRGEAAVPIDLLGTFSVIGWNRFESAML